jgi:hypothetical protein
MVAGSPIGTAAYVNADATASASRVGALAGRLLDLPLATQDKFMLLRNPWCYGSLTCHAPGL